MKWPMSDGRPHTAGIKYVELPAGDIDQVLALKWTGGIVMLGP